METLQRIYNFIENMLQQNGFCHRRQGSCILAEKADAKAVIFIQKQFNIEECEKFSQEFSEFKGRKILAVSENISEEDASKIDSEIVIWDDDCLKHELIRLSLESAGIECEGTSIADEIGSTDFPPIASIDVADSISLGDIILRPNVSEKEIEEEYPSSSARVLHLIPYHVFCYSIYSADDASSGSKKIVAVNSLTGSAEKWQNLDIVYTIDVPHNKIQPHLNETDAEKIALEEIIASNSKTKEYIVEDRQTTLTERKIIAPREEEILLEYRCLCHVPMWHVIESTGEIHINAHDRRISDISRSNNAIAQ